MVEGLGSLLDGMMGTGNGTTSTSINVGVVGITKVSGVVFGMGDGTTSSAIPTSTVSDYSFLVIKVTVYSLLYVVRLQRVHFNLPLQIFALNYYSLHCQAWGCI